MSQNPFIKSKKNFSLKWTKNLLPAEEYIDFNAEDPILDTIRVPLPRPPDPSLIENYGLPPIEQKWSPPVVPQRLKDLEKRFATLFMIKKYLLDHQVDYQEELEFIEREWDRRTNGYWIYINRVPTFIDGWHYFYMSYWYLDVGLPDYRDRDRMFFVFARYCYTDTKLSDGTDLFRRICFGFNYPKMRREGATYKAECINYCIITSYYGAWGGIQSMDGPSAKKAFLIHLVMPFKKLPFYFKPNYDGSTSPKSELLFDVPARKQGSIANIDTGLEGGITFADSALAGWYDGWKLMFYHDDETGKCLKLDTPVLMFDGTIKKVQDVVVGDKLMGPDSKPRKVLSLGRGKEMMYDIVPNKGDKWGCNENHLLSLKVCHGTCPKYKKGDIVTISVKDFFKISKNFRRNFVLYKNGVEFSEREHEIDPYMLGVWLGDGHSANSNITNIDTEVIEYLNDYAFKIKNKIIHKKNNNTENSTHTISNGIKKSPILVYDKNGILICEYPTIKETARKLGIETSAIGGYLKGRKRFVKKYHFTRANHDCENLSTKLSKINLLNNKHIPLEYLADSSLNRLQLLAGLIDTDGHRNQKELHYNYEITQKRKELAYQILFLSQSLGFGATIREKTATMKRKDGSIYSCLVYVVLINGENLEKIPCKIPRKQMPVRIHNPKSKRRNPLHCGFDIVPTGEGDYYGFTLDGDRLFMLGDFTVTHNTAGEDTDYRWGIIKKCLAQQIKIHGFSIATSTVGEMAKKGGSSFAKTCKNSHWSQRIKNGQTKSGKYNLFISSYYGMEGFIDIFGNSIVNDPTEDDLWRIPSPIRDNDGKLIGGKRYLDEYLDDVIMDETDESMAKYEEELRMQPREFSECFITAGSGTGFNLRKIINRMKELQFMKDATSTGNFEWENGVQDGKVIWVPNPGGRFKVSLLLRPEQTNRKVTTTIFTEGIFKNVFMPEDPDRFTASSDPFKFSITQGKKMSMGAGSVFWHRDRTIDPDDKPFDQWESYRNVCTYLARPATIEIYCEDMLKMCIYYGAMMYGENNIPVVWNWLAQRGYDGYLKYAVDLLGKKKLTPGFQNKGESIRQELFLAHQKYIESHCHREMHIDVLQDVKHIKGLDELTLYDLFVSVAGGYIGAGIGTTRAVEPAHGFDVGRYF